VVKYPFVQFEVSSIEIEAACFLRGDVMVHSTRLVPCSGLFRRRGRHVRSWAKPARDWPARFSGCNATNQGAKKSKYRSAAARANSSLLPSSQRVFGWEQILHTGQLM
jgi:hypothetical protein